MTSNDSPVHLKDGGICMYVIPVGTKILCTGPFTKRGKGNRTDIMYNYGMQ